MEKDVEEFPAPNDDFFQWIKSNGGDDEIIQKLRCNGFTSKLSLSNLDFSSEDAGQFVKTLNCGQKCLLQGLVKLLNPDAEPKVLPGGSSRYASGSSKASSLSDSAVSGSSTIKGKISKLFNFGGREGESSSRPEFKPTQDIRGKRPAASGGKGKGPMKKKISQLKVSIVALPAMTKKTPTGVLRSQLSHTIWINKSASEEEVRKQILEQLGCRTISFMYAQGKNLRQAHLSDVQNAESWDADTLRALMGNGALYVLKNPPSRATVSDSGSDDDFTSVVRGPASMTTTASIHLGNDSSDHDLPVIDLTTTSYTPQRDVPGPNIATDTAATLISDHATKVLDQSAEYIVSIDRSTPEVFWSGVVSFYKGARGNPSKLKKYLVVNFVNTGEFGSDCGALKREFFEDALRTANEMLFEGEYNRRIPRKDFPLELQFEVTGMLVAHSILQQGPGIPCLSQAVYDYLVHGDPTMCYPAVEDIPLNLATHELLTLIEKFNMATSDEELDQLLDDPAFSTLLNHSSWSLIEPVNKSNKHALLQQLILEEVIIRREVNLKALRRGLQVLGLCDLLELHPQSLQHLFVAGAQVKILSAQQFRDAISSTCPAHDSDKAAAYNHFMALLTFLEDGNHDYGEDVSLSSLLRFMTGLSVFPPMGLSTPLQIKYHSTKDHGNQFPFFSACTNTVVLPISYSIDERDAFISAFVKAFQFGGGFGSA